MPDRHKTKPISLRLPEADQAWLNSYAERTGQPKRRILLKAVAHYRASIEQTSATTEGAEQ